MGPSSLQASCKLFGNYANYSFWGIYLVALPGLEPGLFALRGRRVNQLHHNAMNGWGTRCDLLIIAKVGWVEKPWVRFLTAEYWWSWGRNTGVSPLRPAASGRDDGVGR